MKPVIPPQCLNQNSSTLIVHFYTGTGFIWPTFLICACIHTFGPAKCGKINFSFNIFAIWFCYNIICTFTFDFSSVICDFFSLSVSLSLYLFSLSIFQHFFLWIDDNSRRWKLTVVETPFRFTELVWPIWTAKI